MNKRDKYVVGGVVAILLLVSGGVAIKFDEPNSPDNVPYVQESSKIVVKTTKLSPNEFTKHKIGESVSLLKDNSVTVTQVKEEKDFGLEGKTQNNKQIQVNVTIKNNDKNTLTFNPQDFELYNSDNKIGQFDNNTFINKIQQSIKPNETVNMKLYYTITGNAPYIVAYHNVTWE